MVWKYDRLVLYFVWTNAIPITKLETLFCCSSTPIDGSTNRKSLYLQCPIPEKSQSNFWKKLTLNPVLKIKKIFIELWVEFDFPESYYKLPRQLPNPIKGFVTGDVH